MMLLYYPLLYGQIDSTSYSMDTCLAMISGTLLSKPGIDNNLNAFQQTDNENVTLKKISSYY